MNAVSSAVGLLEIVVSIVAAAYCCRVVCCGQPSTTMVSDLSVKVALSDYF